MDYIKQYEDLLSQKKDITKQLADIEKNYVEAIMQKQGLSIGDLVKTPNGTKGFLKGVKVSTFGSIDFWMAAVKKDGTPSLNNAATYCNFNELKLV